MRKTSLLAALTFCWSAGFFIAAPADPEPGWKLVQNCQLTGRVYVSLTKRALQVYEPKRKLSVFAFAPKWNVQVYNERAKTYVDLPMNKFHHPMYKSMAAFIGPYLDQIPFAKTGDLKRGTMKMAVYGSTAAYEQQEAEIIRSKHTESNAPRRLEAQYCLSFDLPDQLGHIMALEFGLPHLDGVPIEFGYITFKKLQRSYLVTENCAPAELTIVAPKNYRRQNSLADLMNDEDTKLMIEELSPMKIYQP